MHSWECSTANNLSGKRRRSSSEVPKPVRRSQRLQEQQIRKQSSNKVQPQSLLQSTPLSKTPKAGASQCVHFWIRESRWPEASELEMDAPAPKRSRLSTSPSRQSDDGTPIPSDGSDQRSRTQRSSPYAQTGYATLLALKGGHMNDSKAGILAKEKKICHSLLTKPQPYPRNTLFDNSCFIESCENLQNENETRVVIDLLRLIAPSAENLAAKGLQSLGILKEHTNAGWNESIPVEGPRPQPDFCVGFRFSAFSEDQIKKLQYSLKLGTKTYFSATLELYFPFFTSEVKGAESALNIADRQNAHSMTVAIRGIVELYRRIGRAKELHRKALGFSISHDHREVRIYVHYPEIDDLTTRCYRHTLREFFITDKGGKERWRAYQFVRNIYDEFVPTNFQRIKNAVDQLPEPTAQLYQSIQSTENAESSQKRTATSGPSSQEVHLKKPDLPSKRGITAKSQAQLDEAKQREEKHMEQVKQREEQLMSLLRQQTPSSANTTESALQAQLDEAKQREEKLMQREEKFMQEKEQLMSLLLQRIPSSAYTTESALQKQIEGLQKQLEEVKRRDEQSKEQITK